MVDLIEIRDELQHTLLWGLLLLFRIGRRHLQIAKDLDQSLVLVEDGAEQALPVERLRIALTE